MEYYFVLNGYVFYLQFVFLYQIFGNCNSKQAKRNNSTNPLEFLLDHCFDSCVSFLLYFRFCYWN